MRVGGDERRKWKGKERLRDKEKKVIERKERESKVRSWNGKKRYGFLRQE